MDNHTKHSDQKKQALILASKHSFGKRCDYTHTFQFISPLGKSIFEDGFPRVMFAEQFNKIRKVRT